MKFRTPRTAISVAVRALTLCAALSTFACASARLEPASADQKVPNKPNAARMEIANGVRLQVEANAWMADERVKNEVTTMKVTLINRGSDGVKLDYNGFTLESDSGEVYKPVDPKSITIRGSARSIGLPADTIITRSSDSAVNTPDRETSEKDALRKRLEDQALTTGEVPSGERTVGYIYFERVPASVKLVTFRGNAKLSKSGKSTEDARLEFRPRQFQ